MDPTPVTPVRPRGTITLFRLPTAGGERIPLRIHWTLLVAIPYFAIGFAPALIARGGAPIGEREGYLLGVLLSTGLFVGVALHELAHTLVGIRLGARVRGITLMFLGGVSELARPPSRPLGEVVMAAVGPAASLLIALVAWLVSMPMSGRAAAFFLLFAQVNLAIGVFNLLPAFPLDGGRVLRGSLSYAFGPDRATRIASFVGRISAVLLGAAGLYGGNIVLTLIAVFIFSAATAEQRATSVAP